MMKLKAFTLTLVLVATLLIPVSVTYASNWMEAML